MVLDEELDVDQIVDNHAMQSTGTGGSYTWKGRDEGMSRGVSFRTKSTHHKSYPRV